MTSDIKRLTILYHCIGWALFISYELGLSLYSGSQIRAVVRLSISYALNIMLFYVHIWGLHRYFGADIRFKYIKTALFIIAESILLLSLKIGADMLLSPAGHSLFSNPGEAGQIISLNFARTIYFIGLSSFYWSAGYISRLQKKAAESKVARMELEMDKNILETTLTRLRNLHLQQQLNPHMLFNTLNFIYSNVAEHSAEASRGVILLSEIMRFSMEEADDDGKIPVAHELAQVINLVELNRLRFDHPLLLDFEIGCEDNEAMIIPLVLLTLAENMFKHGDFTGEPALLHLMVSRTGRLVLSTRNKKRPEVTPDNRKNIGLDNTRLRLDNYYTGAYQLEILEDEMFFELKLIMLL